MRVTKAFTLVELLIVVVVLVLLLALVIPVVSGARRAAQDTRSLANLQQIGVALTTFVSDNNGFIMPRAYAVGGNPSGQDRYWTATLFNRGYLPDKHVFYDPRFPPFRPDFNSSSQTIESGTPATYGMRDWVKSGETIGTLTARVAKPVAVVSKPSDFFIVADSYWMAWGTQGYGISPGANSENRVRLDEKGMAGTLFLDGHVEKKPREYFETLDETQGEYSDHQPFATWSATPIP